MIIDTELETKVEGLCHRLHLGFVFEYVRTKNPSNNLPYHSWYHILCMVEKCIEGAQFHNLPYRSMQHLVVGALFHDFAHSGGKYDDSYNIEIALAGFDRFNYYISGMDRFEIVELIKVTEYPYVLDPISIEQKIIRDADLMQSFRPTWKEMIIDGLAQEMSIRAGHTITPKEMCVGQLAFLSSVYPKSDWGQKIMIQQRQLAHATDRFQDLLSELQ